MDWLAVALRFGLYLDLMLLFGTAAFALHALRGAERTSGAVLPLLPVALATAAAGIALSVLGLLDLTAATAGTALFAVDRDTFDVLLWNTGVGTAWIVRIAALLATAVAALALRRTPRVANLATAAGGALALATLAWGGHGAMHEGVSGELHLAVDIAHLFAAALWIGALFCLAALVLPASIGVDAARLRLAHRALAGFSAMGTLAVAVLIVTGTANALWIVGPTGFAGLPATRYGVLLFAKLLLFAAMLALATANRFRLVPRFEAALAAHAHQLALAALRRSLAAETLLGVAILALVGWLGTLDPSGGQ